MKKRRKGPPPPCAKQTEEKFCLPSLPSPLRKSPLLPRFPPFLFFLYIYSVSPVFLLSWRTGGSVPCEAGEKIQHFPSFRLEREESGVVVVGGS